MGKGEKERREREEEDEGDLLYIDAPPRVTKIGYADHKRV